MGLRAKVIFYIAIAIFSALALGFMSMFIQATYSPMTGERGRGTEVFPFFSGEARRTFGLFALCLGGTYAWLTASLLSIIIALLLALALVAYEKRERRVLTQLFSSTGSCTSL